MKFYLNGIEIKSETGLTTTYTLDETLDSGSFVLKLTSVKNAIAPMTSFIIDDELGKRKQFYISSDTVEIASKQPLIYKHNLTFIQNSRKFSKYQVRNTVFSQPAKTNIKGYTSGSYQNDTTLTNMTVINVPIENAVEITNKTKVEDLRLEFKLNLWTYENGSTFNIDQSTSLTIPSITFDIYRGDNFLMTLTYTNVYNGSNLSLEEYRSELTQVGVYSIKNINIPITTNVGYLPDIWVISIYLNYKTYYYTLYDILNILKEQMSLVETQEETTVLAPTITKKYTYIASSGSYQVDIIFENPNDFETTLHYSSSGDLIASGTAVLSSGEITTISLGTVVSGTGVVSGYLISSSNVQSTTTNLVWNVAKSTIVAPIITWNNDNTYTISNTNKFACVLYYKIYNQSLYDEPSEYTQLNMTSESTITSTDIFNNCLVIWDLYFINEASQVSSHTTGNKIIGTAQLRALILDSAYLSDYNSSTGTATLNVSYTNNNIESVTGYFTYGSTSIATNLSLGVGTNSFTISGITYESSTIVCNYVSSSTLGYSNSTSSNTLTYSVFSKLTAPTITTLDTTNPSTGSWLIKATVENANSKSVSCHFYANSLVENTTTIAAYGSSVVSCVSTTETGTFSAYFTSSTASQSDTTTVNYPLNQLLALDIQSATLEYVSSSYANLVVSVNNYNSVAVTAIFRYQGGAYTESHVLATGANSFTISNVPNSSSSCWFEGCSSSGYVKSDNSNTVAYSQAVLPTLTPIVIVHAALGKPTNGYSTLTVTYTNDNAVAVVGLLKTSNGDSVSKTYQTGTANTLSISTLNAAGICYVNSISADGYQDGAKSNDEAYSQYVGTLNIKGMGDSYNVGDLFSIHCEDADGNYVSCSWTSSNTSVATVGSSGSTVSVHCVGTGTFIIYANAYGYSQDSASSTVYPAISPTSVSVSASMSKTLAGKYSGTVSISNSTGASITSISVGDMNGLTVSGSTSCSSGSSVSWSGTSDYIFSTGETTGSTTITYTCDGSSYSKPATYTIPS